MVLDGVKWEQLPPPEELDGDLPYATHKGCLELGDMKLKCYQLSNGQRVFDAGDVDTFLGVLAQTPNH